MTLVNAEEEMIDWLVSHPYSDDDDFGGGFDSKTSEGFKSRDWSFVSKVFSEAIASESFVINC